MSIPSRFQKQHFDSLAAVWAEAVRTYPETITVIPGSLSVDTLARKLRDARFAKNKWGYLYPEIDEALWAQNNLKVKVGIGQDGKVKLGPLTPKTIEPVGVPIKTGEYLILWDTRFDLDRVCDFLGTVKIEPKPYFVIKDLSPAEIRRLEGSFNVGFVQLTENKWQVV
jgi:hypothetical protein